MSLSQIGKKHTNETKNKISKSNKGKKLSIQHKINLSKAHKGKTLSIDHKNKIGLASKGHQAWWTQKGLPNPIAGNKLSKKTKEKIGKANKGKTHSVETKNKISKSLIGNKYNWKGGISSINSKIRNCQKYKEWRLFVFKRDNFTCLGCGQIGGELNAHHIKSFAKYPELRFEITNGITVCKSCHDIIHKINKS